MTEKCDSTPSEPSIDQFPAALKAVKSCDKVSPSDISVESKPTEFYLPVDSPIANTRQSRLTTRRSNHKALHRDREPSRLPHNKIVQAFRRRKHRPKIKKLLKCAFLSPR